MTMPVDDVKKIIEAAILSAGDPVNMATLRRLFDEQDCPDAPALRSILEELARDYEGHGIELKEVGSGFRFQARTELAPWISRLTVERPPRYSRAFLETLALIAYRQPITRAEIEDVRGVAVNSNTIRILIDREWVRVVGHKDVPGKPALLATTKKFLDYFNLQSLGELPALEELRDLDAVAEQLELQLPRLDGDLDDGGVTTDGIGSEEPQEDANEDDTTTADGTDDEEPIDVIEIEVEETQIEETEDEAVATIDE